MKMVEDEDCREQVEKEVNAILTMSDDAVVKMRGNSQALKFKSPNARTQEIMPALPHWENGSSSEIISRKARKSLCVTNTLPNPLPTSPVDTPHRSIHSMISGIYLLGLPWQGFGLRSQIP